MVLTTRDNPFNPVTQNEAWLNYDMNKGYNTYGLIARIADYSSDLDDASNDERTEAAIAEILHYNPLLYALVDEKTDIRAMNKAFAESSN